jgi:hypothetical protein
MILNARKNPGGSEVFQLIFYFQNFENKRRKTNTKWAFKGAAFIMPSLMSKSTFTCRNNNLIIIYYFLIFGFWPAEKEKEKEKEKGEDFPTPTK